MEKIMDEKEEIILNSKIYKMDVLITIDIPRELISIEDGLYAIWSGYEDNEKEIWFIVECDKKILEEYYYRKCEIGEIFKSGDVKISYRYYKNYMEFEIIDDDIFSVMEKYNLEFPDCN